MSRNPAWTESIAVGSEEFVRNMTALTGLRRSRLYVEQTPEDLWVLKESREAYA